MSQLVKLQAAFRACRGPFEFDKFDRMMGLMGYEYLARGKTGGSRRRLHHPQTGHVVMFHEPHGPDMCAGAVKAIRQDLTDKGLL